MGTWVPQLGHEVVGRTGVCVRTDIGVTHARDGVGRIRSVKR